jgi:hypothetical protein
MVICLLAGLAALALLLFGLHQERRLRLVRDLPTVAPGGVFIGLVETSGTVASDITLTAGLTDTACVWHDWSIEERWSRTVTETHTDSKGRRTTSTRHDSGWTEVASGGQFLPFDLRDGTGSVRICADRATVRAEVSLDRTCDTDDPLYYGRGPRQAIAHSDHRRRFRESIIPPGAHAWVIGQARQCTDMVAAEIAHDPAAPLFVIALDGEARVERSYWWSSLLPKLGGLLIAALVPALTRHGDEALSWALIGGGAFCAAWLLGWIWLAYNGLIELRQRVRQGWANIDVQLKRRHDLIGNLLPLVQALSDHERLVHVTVASMRTQLSVTPPGQPGPDVALLGGQLRVLAEAYPALTAHDAFSRLHATLIDTEDRIAMARGWYNTIASNWNTRLERVPEGWLAALSGLRRSALLVA